MPYAGLPQSIPLSAWELPIVRRMGAQTPGIQALKGHASPRICEVRIILVAYTSGSPTHLKQAKKLNNNKDQREDKRESWGREGWSSMAITRGRKGVGQGQHRARGSLKQHRPSLGGYAPLAPSLPTGLQGAGNPGGKQGLSALEKKWKARNGLFVLETRPGLIEMGQKAWTWPWPEVCWEQERGFEVSFEAA